MKRVLHVILTATAAIMGIVLPCVYAATGTNSSTVIVTASSPSSLETFAAQEIQRYVYVRYGELVSIVNTTNSNKMETSILLSQKDQPVLKGISFEKEITGLKKEEYLLKTVKDGKVIRFYIIGGDNIGVLFGAYRFAEKMGIRFYLEGEIIPDFKAAFALPDINEKGSPIFAIRGIQPFHDFPEGPDWWNADDYKAIFAQLPKLRMNFFGLHTYPENAPNAEPGVWIGMPQDSDAKGNVAFSYPSSFQNNQRGNWGYKAKSITDYSHGSANLFAFDNYGAEVMGNSLPGPDTAEESNAVFDRTGELFKDTFTYARQLGIKLCIGTETPLIIPKKLQARLKEKGLNPDDPKTTEILYEGIFKRIMATHPLDYYWFWTPETWTWQGNTKEQLDKTKADITAAIAAAKKLNAPFDLATCGWVLGPTPERSMFDEFLPKTISMSCINRQVGKEPVEPDFAKVKGRSTWAIPWMEDDPALTVPQLWAGRMRADALDAKLYGCNGLIGIHWRTRILSPNIGALADAAWDQHWAPQNPQPENRSKNRHLPTQDFYQDWAASQFGPEAAKEIAPIFASLDGKLPCPADWVDGPGGINKDTRPWNEAQKDYAFLSKLEKLRSKVQGAGNRERYEYWLNQFQYLKIFGQISCVSSEYSKVFEQLNKEKDPTKQKQIAKNKALPIHKELLRLADGLYPYLLNTVNTTGELGTVMNWEQHNFSMFIDAPAAALKSILGEDIPDSSSFSKTYKGKVRLIVPAVRTNIEKQDSLTLQIIVLDKEPAKEATLYWREMGKGKFQAVEATHLRRGVYKVQFPAEITKYAHFEYYITAKTGGGKKLVFPATAPRLNQTVTVMEK